MCLFLLLTSTTLNNLIFDVRIIFSFVKKYGDKEKMGLPGIEPGIPAKSRQCHSR